MPRRLLGNGLTKTGRQAHNLYRHTTTGFSLCAVLCVGFGQQANHGYFSHGTGCCFIGGGVGFANKRVTDRACVNQTVSGGPFYASQGYSNDTLSSKQGDWEVGVGKSMGFGMSQNFIYLRGCPNRYPN